MSYYKPINNVYVEYDDDDIPIVDYTTNRRRDSGPIDVIYSKKYPNNTFIDWYVETKNIPKSTSLIYKKWGSIIVTAIVAGYTVTLINLASVWINDLRKGLCFSKLDKWSLLNPYLTCPAEDWYDWSKILFNSDKFLTSAFINFPIYVILGSVTAFLATYVSQKEITIQQSGIPEVKAIIQGFQFNLSGYLGLKTLLYKIIGLILVVSSGFWLGKEGPLVHVSCCIINVIYNMIMGKSNNNEAVRRELLSAATATGISLAFNSPIGGVLFVLECIPSYFIATTIMWNSFISATISLIVLVGFKLFTEGKNFNETEMFLVEFGNVSWLVLEIFPFIGLGILGGLYGYFFIRIYSRLSSNNLRGFIQLKLCHIFKMDESKANYVEILCIFFITCLLNFPITITRLPLEAFLKSLFTNCESTIDSSSNSENFMCSASDVQTLFKLAYIGIQAFIISAYTFGTILPGGVLMPSLVIGAVCGRFVGILSKAIQELFVGSLDTCTSNSCLVSPASYAVIGAGAFMTGITKLTMCVVVILFELTGAVSYVLPIMIAVMVLKFVSDYLVNENIYDSWLKYNFNLDRKTNLTAFYNEGKGNGLVNYSTSTATIKNKLPDIPVSRVMIPVKQTKCLLLIPDEPYTYTSLQTMLNNDKHEGYPLIVSQLNPLFLGYVQKETLFNVLNSIDHNQQNSISFQVSGITSEVLSQQMRYEQQLETVTKLDLTPEHPFIIINDKASFTLVIDIFEKMYLNYLIIQNSSSQNVNVMSGFIDRFIVARLIDEGFESLNDELPVEYMEFDIENQPEQSEQHLRSRDSIELIT